MTALASNRDARADRLSRLGESIAESILAVAAIVRRARDRGRQRRRARAIWGALWGLDDRALHDLGIHRSEIGSIAAELTGTAECTRRRTAIEWRTRSWSWP